MIVCHHTIFDAVLPRRPVRISRANHRVRPDMILLDGGTGQELLRRSAAPPTPLWSAQVMFDQPELVREVHADYLHAGADIITLNAYSATPCRLNRYGLADQFVALQQAAGELAHQARDQAGRPTAQIAGCLSPFGWSYRPDLAPPYDELVNHYGAIAELQQPYVDLFVCETMSSIAEGRAALEAARPFARPVWVAFTVADDDGTRLRSGESLAEALAAVNDADAVLVNCSPPESIDRSMSVLAAEAGPRPFGAYANGFTHIASEFEPGTTTTVLGQRRDLTPEAYTDHVIAWRDAGATIVGGCCEIGPAHIRSLAARLADPPTEAVEP